MISGNNNDTTFLNSINIYYTSVVFNLLANMTHYLNICQNILGELMLKVETGLIKDTMTSLVNLYLNPKKLEEPKEYHELNSL